MTTNRFTIATFVLSASVWAAAPAARVTTYRSLHESIRAGDLDAMRAMLDTGADPDARDADGTPAIMNAALYGTAAHIKLLLDRGAKADARNDSETTALIWAAGDPDKVRLLVQAGADVNARSKFGRTPLMVAANAAGNAASVKLLLDKGARVDVRDEIGAIPVLPTGGGKGTALIEAARTGDLESVKMLVAAGADVKAATPTGVNPLSEAVLYQRRDIVRFLLDKGAPIDTPVSVLRFPILAIAAMRSDTEIAAMLIAAKADVNAADANGNTPLMWAATSERDNTRMLDALLKAGADAKARNKGGETALDWATRRGQTSLVKRLKAAGAETGVPRTVGSSGDRMGAATDTGAMELAMGALYKSVQVSAKKSGCVTCHNHTAPLVAAAAAAKRGVRPDDEAIRKVTVASKAMMTPAAAALLESTDTFPDVAISGAYILEAMAAQGQAPDRITAALVHKIAQSQLADGHWAGWAPRPPLEHGDIQATALAVRAITMYPIPGRAEEMKRRIARARAWLSAATPVTHDDFTMRLRGLAWSNAPEKEVRAAARQLAFLQRNDGGWGQLKTLPSDAYATATAMIALIETGNKWANIEGGKRFLRDTQFADGSWQVRTRAYPFQPLVDAGFPHGRDQWISAAATSVSVMALAMASN